MLRDKRITRPEFAQALSFRHYVNATRDEQNLADLTKTNNHPKLINNGGPKPFEKFRRLFLFIFGHFIIWIGSVFYSILFGKVESCFRRKNLSIDALKPWLPFRAKHKIYQMQSIYHSLDDDMKYRNRKLIKCANKKNNGRSWEESNVIWEKMLTKSIERCEWIEDYKGCFALLPSVRKST